MTKTIPTDKERRKLLTSLQKQVTSLHGRDIDGDRYAVVEVHDRRDGQWPYIRPVPRVPFDNPTPEQVLAAIDAASSNVEATSRMLEQVRRDVIDYFEKARREMDIRAAVKAILGETAIVGRAYERSEDTPRWCRWECYRVKESFLTKPPVMQCCFFNEVNGFDTGEFKKWLKAGGRSLTRKYGKQIRGWYVRTEGSTATSLYALVETPEKERPAIIALKRAKRELLEANAGAIEWSAKMIEAELRAKK